MGKIYVGQVDVEIKANLNVTLGAPDVLKINYRKPDGTTGVFPSAGNANVVETTKAQYFTLAEDFDQGGLWCFQGYTELPGGFKGYGEEFYRWIYDPATA